MSVYIIGEIGINHDGDREKALKLIKMAKDCGADAVKFQKRTVDVVYSAEELEKPRASKWGNTVRDQKEGLELGSPPRHSKQDYDIIFDYCKSLGIDCLASAWDFDSLNFIEEYEPRYHKIASAMVTNLDFCRAVAVLGRHTLISTGMCTEGDIDNVVEIFLEEECEFTLLHCVSLYPPKPMNCNLKAISTLAEMYSCPVGYSDHTASVWVAPPAITLGASVIECHITLDRRDPGSDHASSLERGGLERIVEWGRLTPIVLGDGKLGMQPGEEITAEKLRYFEK